MKFTFESEQFDGTTVKMNFDGESLYYIQEMFKQFLSGSGFLIIEDDIDMYTKDENNDTSEECVHETDISLDDVLLRQKHYFEYLNKLRDSGETNMWGAPEYLVKSFGLEKFEAKKIVSTWMDSLKT
jgi:hypothetical protein